MWKSGPTEKPFWNFYSDWGWTDEDFVRECHIAADAGMIFSGPPRVNAYEATWTLYGMGHDLIVITDRPFGATPEVSQALTKNWWVENDFPPYEEIHFSSDKTIVQTDIFVEDKWENANALVAAGVETWMINRPWNRDRPYPHRIDDIKNFPAKVNELAAYKAGESQDAKL